MIDYQWVFPHEADFRYILAVTERRGWTRPHPDLSRALMAFEGGTPIGFLIVQPANHCEPIYVEPEYRGTGIAEQLSDQVFEFMKSLGAGFMIIADTDAAVRLCEARGLKRITRPVFVF